MTKTEFSKLALAMRTYYPKENLIPNDQASELWYYQLKDIDYKVAEVMLCQWVATNKWSPTIADIRELCTTVTQGELKDWGDGWQQVIDNIRYYGYYRQEEAMEHMDEITRIVVKRLGWQNLCLSENVPADRANFRNIYEQLQHREKLGRQLPDTLKLRISKIRDEIDVRKVLGIEET